MKTFLSALLAIASCVAVHGQSNTDGAKANFSKNNYQIQYPKMWRLDTSGIMGTDLFIFSLPENETDKFRENVNVLIQDLSGQNINLEKYKQLSEKQIADMPNDCKIFESSIIKTANKEYLKLIYAMTQGNFKLKITSVCIIKNNKAYLATFTAESAKYEEYKKAGEEILGSFHLTAAN